MPLDDGSGISTYSCEMNIVQTQRQHMHSFIHHMLPSSPLHRVVTLLVKNDLFIESASNIRRAAMLFGVLLGSGPLYFTGL
jgi:hypothetical protein